MSMMEEIEKLMQSVQSSANYRILNLGGKSVYIDGIKSVISLSDVEIKFQLKREVLTILGEGLIVKYLDASTCVANGEIYSVVAR